MPRKGPAVRRELAPDPVYRSVLVTQFTNKILSRGKRTVAERIIYTALDTVKERTDSDPVAVLKRAVENVRPELEVRSRRVGGATYQAPLKFDPVEQPRWQFVGSLASRSHVVKRRWQSVLRMKFLTLRTVSAPQSSVVRTYTRWLNQTRHSLTTAGRKRYNVKV